MNSKEIKVLQQPEDSQDNPIWQLVNWRKAVVFWLIEIAYQIAVMNERKKEEGNHG